MAKTKLLQSTRDALHTWMLETYDKKHYPALIKPRVAAIEVANAAIRTKYSEEDMVILRKYKLVSKDGCLKFVNNQTQEIFGVNFAAHNYLTGKYEELTTLADLPYRTGCHSSDVFSVNTKTQKIIETFVTANDDYVATRKKKNTEYRQFLDACKYVEDVAAVIPFTKEMKDRYFSGGMLMVVTPERLAELKKEFS